VARAIAFLSARFQGVPGDILLTARSEPQEANAGRVREYRLKRPVDVERLTQIIVKEDRPNRALFFCVGTLKPDATKSLAGFYRSKSNIHELPGLHVDVDFRQLALGPDINPTAAVTKALIRSRWAPAPLVLTGGGMHGYWRTPEPIGANDFEQAEAVMKALARHFGGDPSVAEVSRLMRLPGTENWKYGEPRRCLVSLHGEARLDIWDEEVGAGEPIFEQIAAGGGRTQMIGDTRQAYASSEPGAPFLAYAAEHATPIDPNDRLAAMAWHGAGESGVHATQLSVTAALLNAGVPPDEVIEWVLAETMAKPFAEGWDVQRERRKIAGMVGTFVAKLVAEGREVPNGPAHVNGDSEPKPKPAAPPLPKLPFIDIAAWEGTPIPTRLWSVEERIPAKQPTLLTGEGGGGKSLIELMLLAAHALGRDWLGVPTTSGPTLYLSAEDDDDELHRRLADVMDHYGATYTDLVKGGMHLLSYANSEEGCLLATVARDGRIQETTLYKQMLEAAHDLKPIHIGIDTLADVFGGNEIDRSQVRQFIGLLRRLAMAAEGSLVLVAHPSLTGISSGSGLSGSTHWHNGVRARMYFRTLKSNVPDEEDTVIDPNGPRELAFMKNNYGPIAQSIVLRYQNGVYVPQTTSSFQGLAREAEADDYFLAMLRKFTAQKRSVCHNVHAPNFAPTAFANHPGSDFASKELRFAMERLLERQIIKIITVGSPSRQRQNLVEVTHSGEE
jgi:RecA-family ATPase